MSDRKQQIQDSYKNLGGGFAGFYDGLVSYSTTAGKIANKIMWGFDDFTTSQWLNSALSGIPENFSGKLLEVPVGTGVLTMPLYQTLPDAEITCLDYSADIMENARKRAEYMNIKNIDFRQGDAGALPFPDESFDIVLIKMRLLKKLTECSKKAVSSAAASIFRVKRKELISL